MMPMSPGLIAAIGAKLDPSGKPFQVFDARPIPGGCIHQARRITTSHGVFFLKLNGIQAAPMFSAEAKGLELLAATDTFPIPAPLAVGNCEGQAFLLMDWIAPAAKQPHYFEVLGERLAALHAFTSLNHGLDHDNFIGSLPQHNAWAANWATFFVHHRLQPQLRMAVEGKRIDSRLARQMDRLMHRIEDLIPESPPSLLHGDLWSGNVITGASGAATLIDPAVYFGHREAEIAFTKLFGGFEQGFYDAYQATWQLESGWQSRVALFNLYPLMVHLNLFGQAYLPDIQETVQFYV